MEDTTPKKLNIYEKIQNVAAEIKGIEKDMSVSTGQNSTPYKAVSDKNVILKVKLAEQKHRIVSIPRRSELIKSDTLMSAPDQWGKVKTTFVDIVKITLDIVDLDEPTSVVSVESFGRGVDNGDKGFGKAMTYARKYALLNAYKIATGVDPDQVASRDVEQAPHVDTLKLQVLNYLLSNDKFREQILSHFGLSSTDELTQEQTGTIYANLKKKGLVQ